MNTDIILKEWENEEDYYNFSYKGYNCLIIRHAVLKHLCGYICLTNLNNRFFDKNLLLLEHELDYLIDYAEFTEKRKSKNKFSLKNFGDKNKKNFRKLYHLPYSSNKGRRNFIIGRAFANYNDIVPKLSENLLFKDLFSFKEQTYKNVEYVKTYLKSIIDQF